MIGAGASDFLRYPVGGFRDIPCHATGARRSAGCAPCFSSGLDLGGVVAMRPAARFFNGGLM